MTSSTAQSALANFLSAFSRLDLDAMLDYIDPEATAFFPSEHQRIRLEGRDAIGRAFAAVIAQVRAIGATIMPLDAEDLVVQQRGDIAVATFHLRGEDLSRRTFVLQRAEAQWRIVHIHASNAPRDE